jgi:transcriptional regulator with XRE-family HTH domain
MALRIKALRTARQMSQQTLADKAGLSRSQLSEIETEAKAGNTLRLASIARALGVTPAELYEPQARDVYTDEIVALMHQMRDEDRAAILRMAKALASQD